jgi:hypothetical protein
LIRYLLIVSDFGLSKASNLTSTFKGTELYFAPEFWNVKYGELKG